MEGPAFTDAIRMYRQSKELYGTWEMLCGNEVQVRPGRLRKSARGPEGGLSTPAGPRALAAVWTQMTSLGLDGWRLRWATQVVIFVQFVTQAPTLA